MKYYLIGIKGSGMASLAIILKGLGHEVRGADINSFIFTQDKLKENNITIDSFDDMHYEDYKYIIEGNAFINKFIFEDKVVLSYQKILSDICENHFSIAVCGTHGKTTTTTMITRVLEKVNKVSYLIGDGSGKGVTGSKYFVFEACEHRDHFLNYYPNIIVCTNIDYDHVEYFKNKKQYKKSFYNFFSHGNKIILHNKINYKGKNCVTFDYNYGDIKAYNVKYSESGVYFDLKAFGMNYNHLFLPLYGKTLFLDALACISCCLSLNINIKIIMEALSEFKSASRRFNIKELKTNIIVDDYGHHPKEILATIEAIKQKYPSKKIILIYHPDRPKRLLTFKNGFYKVFRSVDDSYMLPFIDIEKDDEKRKAFNEVMFNSIVLPFTNNFYTKKYENTVFLFTGSKEMINQINRLINILNKYDD